MVQETSNSTLSNVNILIIINSKESSHTSKEARKIRLMETMIIYASKGVARMLIFHYQIYYYMKMKISRKDMSIGQMVYSQKKMLS